MENEESEDRSSRLKRVPLGYGMIMEDVTQREKGK